MIGILSSMARLFLSHSSHDNAAAIALRDWLTEYGYDDIFLDIDPTRGLVSGERWQAALKAAADRCEAVLFLISPAWLNSSWCLDEFLLAKTMHKRIFGLIIEPVQLSELPTEMTTEWQLCDLISVEFHQELTRFRAEFPLRFDPCSDLALAVFSGGHGSDRHGVTERDPPVGASRPAFDT
jgi:hypothetical protein